MNGSQNGVKSISYLGTLIIFRLISHNNKGKAVAKSLPFKSLPHQNDGGALFVSTVPVVSTLKTFKGKTIMLTISTLGIDQKVDTFQFLVNRFSTMLNDGLVLTSNKSLGFIFGLINTK
ncbi:hypothetical protein NC651_038251 [Populus alba x Populus x berolinensis]|nr:hypothetical protein NC651_038251 [Populus alba x Populus x berolinensis]